MGFWVILRRHSHASKAVSVKNPATQPDRAWDQSCVLCELCRDTLKFELEEASSVPPVRTGSDKNNISIVLTYAVCQAL